MKQFKELRLLAFVFALVVVAIKTLLLRCFVEIVPLNAGVLATEKEHLAGRVYDGKDVTYIVA